MLALRQDIPTTNVIDPATRSRRRDARRQLLRPPRLLHHAGRAHRLRSVFNPLHFHLDPKLGSLSNNGGPTLTMMPLSGSPVIDAGSNARVPSGISTDQRGYARIFNGTVDIGAAELGASLSPALTSPIQTQATPITTRRVR